MHDGMPYGLIQGQDQGHVALKFRNSSIFKIYLVRHFAKGADRRLLIPLPISKFNRAFGSNFLMSLLVFVSRDFELRRTWLAGGVDRQSRTALISITVLFTSVATSVLRSILV